MPTKPDINVFTTKVLKLVAVHLRSSDWANALAVSWTILRGYEEQTNELSKLEFSPDIQSDELVELLLDYAMDCYDKVPFEDSESGLSLSRQMVSQPFCLVWALDQMLMYGTARADGSDGSAFGTLNGVAGPFRLSPVEYEFQFAVPSDTKQRYWLLRNRIAFPSAPTQVRSHHPQHFLRYWRIVEESQPGSFVVQAKASRRINSSLRFEDGPPLKFRVMTANFPSIEFDSSFSDAVGGERAWRAKGLKNKLAVGNWVKEYLRIAVEQRVSVLVMPELTIPPEILAQISDELRTISLNDSALKLVVAGSFHVEGEAPFKGRATGRKRGGTYRNRATAFNRFGQVLDEFSHVKLQYVDLRKGRLEGVYENIQTEKALTLIDTPWGIQSILICLDFAQADGTGIQWSKIPMNWVWVPAMSRQASPFQAPAKALALSSTCVIAVANQATADFGGLALGGADGHSGFVHASPGLAVSITKYSKHIEIVDIEHLELHAEKL